MNDGRAFTNFLPSCAYNAALAAKYGVQSNMEFRRFLQANAPLVAAQLQQYRICTTFDDSDCSFLLKPE